MEESLWRQKQIALRTDTTDVMIPNCPKLVSGKRTFKHQAIKFLYGNKTLVVVPEVPTRMKKVSGEAFERLVAFSSI